MSSPRLRLRVPGKLMIAGEYAVLAQGQPAVVAAVDRYLTVTATTDAAFRLRLPSLGIGDVTWRFSDGKLYIDSSEPRLRFVEQAMLVVQAYTVSLGRLTEPFCLTIESDLDDESGKKYGLGSSACVVVGVIAALLHLVGEQAPLAEDTLFRLAAIAHFRAQGSGSGADVAASVYGGWLSYTSFHPGWLTEQLASGNPLPQVVRGPWPWLSVARIALPPALQLCVGWTGRPASTGPLVQAIRSYRARDPEGYEHFLSESTQSVRAFLNGLNCGDYTKVMTALTRNRQALAQLGTRAGAPIETKQLAMLANLAEQHGGAGKPSGAGGGDCGIALTAGILPRQRLHAAWRSHGIEPLQLAVTQTGVQTMGIEPAETDWNR